MRISRKMLQMIIEQSHMSGQDSACGNCSAKSARDYFNSEASKENVVRAMMNSTGGAWSIIKITLASVAPLGMSHYYFESNYFTILCGVVEIIMFLAIIRNDQFNNDKS